MKQMDIKTFREEGYLQELNRTFLHPLGLALQIRVDDDGKEVGWGVLDCRDEGEGMFYNLEGSDEKRNVKFFKNAQNIKTKLDERAPMRQSILGFVVEPIQIPKDMIDEKNFKTE